MPVPSPLPRSQHLALATLTPWPFFLLPFTSWVQLWLWALFLSLHSSGAGLSLTTVFAIIPEGWIPGPALRGGPLIIVGQPLFLRKHNHAF